MAEYWADSRVAAGGAGTEEDPYNAIPNNQLLSGNIWNLAYGSVFDLGGAAFTSGNSTTVRAYGDSTLPKPRFSGTRATLFDCSTASGAVIFEDIAFSRDGAQSGTGLLPYQMTNAASSFTMRRCEITGFNLAIDARQTLKLTLEDCTITGDSTAYGLRGQAQLTRNAVGWSITGNTFNCGTALELYVTDDAGSAGAFTNLLIEDNVMGLASGSGGTAMLLRGKCNATNYDATASITGGNTLVRDTGGAWPAWPNGTVIFLAGWTNVANFGTVTVTAGGGTTSVTVTNLGATITNETAERGKGAGIRDPLRAFVNPTIRCNRIRNCGLTPMFIDNFVGGVLEGNVIEDTVATGQVSAAIEAFNCVGTIARYNRIRNMTGPVTVDSMGIFWDGACENCVAHGNHISGVRPTTTADNSGAALAMFFSTGCVFHHNVAEDCRKGFWAGGVATVGTANNNTFSDCTHGALVNSSPAASAITLKCNAFVGCGTGLHDSATSVVSTNSWWDNDLDVSSGTLADKDAEALETDPEFGSDLTPALTSPLVGAALSLGYTLDASGHACYKSPTIGAKEPLRLRATRT